MIREVIQLGGPSDGHTLVIRWLSGVRAVNPVVGGSSPLPGAKTSLYNTSSISSSISSVVSVSVSVVVSVIQ